MSYCDDCGCKTYNGACTNCHEEIYILEQYDDLDMEYPKQDSMFMTKIREHEKAIAKNRKPDIV